jgi:hypothetical protein
VQLVGRLRLAFTAERRATWRARSDSVGFADVCATTSELGIGVALGAALLRDTTPERRRTIVLIVAVALVLIGHVVHLVLRAS